MSLGAHAGHLHSPAAGSPMMRRLALALAMNAIFTAVEAGVGFATDSLALLSDAGHNLSDVFALALALGAAWLAARPATPNRSFGFRRAEILAALANALALVAIAVLVFVEAARRLGDPPEVAGGWLIVVAGVGIAVNAASALLLVRWSADDLNVRAAFVHLATDALASVGVVLAGVVILATGWEIVDPIAGLAIGVLILASSVGIVRDSVLVLLEAAPPGIDVGEVGRAMAAVPGVVNVHDLHVWQIASGFPALSAHVLVDPGVDCHAARRELERLLAERFALDHTTLQVDHRPDGGLVTIGDGRGLRGSGPR